MNGPLVAMVTLNINKDLMNIHREQWTIPTANNCQEVTYPYTAWTHFAIHGHKYSSTSSFYPAIYTVSMYTTHIVTACEILGTYVYIYYN